jgi:carboxyl-terminal processing protease
MDSGSLRDLQVQTRGEFGGLGIEVTMEDGLVKVVAPIDETPAAKAGVMANDFITKLDDEQVYGLTLNQAVQKMRGPANTKIKLTIIHKGQDKPIDVSIMRDVIRVKSVRFHNEGDDVRYIRITQFNEQTSDGLKKAISDLTSQLGSDKIKGFVIDLRNNPGGLLDQAILVGGVATWTACTEQRLVLGYRCRVRSGRLYRSIEFCLDASDADDEIFCSFFLTLICLASRS